MTTRQPQQPQRTPQQGTQQSSSSFSTWKCHKCRAGPHSNNITHCTGILSNGQTCNHRVCDECPKDDKVPPPNVSKNDWDRTKDGIRTEVKKSERTSTVNMPSTDQGAIVASSEIPYRPQAMHPHYETAQSNIRRGRQMPKPATGGWWRCCHCRSANNPVLAPRACSICGHYRCAACG